MRWFGGLSSVGLLILDFLIFFYWWCGVFEVLGLPLKWIYTHTKECGPKYILFRKDMAT